MKALNLKGVYFQKEFKRFYPNSQLAAQVLGYVGTDDNGLGGMERKFDRDLHGVPGRMLTALDARRHVLDSQEREPDPGQNLVLTIDENIQFMAERALDSALQRTHALNGTVVVQDPYTGQILALAIRPTFNPNDFRHATTSLLKNHAVSDVYEPGSTFKLVTYSAALEQKVTNPDQMIDCQGGKMELAGRIIHDSHPNGVLTVAQGSGGVERCGCGQAGPAHGPGKVHQIHSRLRLRFAQRHRVTRRDARPAPAHAPLVRTRASARSPWDRKSPSRRIQLVTMVSTIANGGVYLPPHILMEQSGQAAAKLHPAAFHPQGELPDPLPAGAHRVISTMTAAQMRKMMEGVVLYGTAKNAAQLNGYTAGGKTGTAQKIDVADPSLFQDEVHRVVCRHSAGEQSGHQRGGDHRLPGRAVTMATSTPVLSSARWRRKYSNTWACPTIPISPRRPDLAKAQADPEMDESAIGPHRRSRRALCGG